MAVGGTFDAPWLRRSFRVVDVLNKSYYLMRADVSELRSWPGGAVGKGDGW